MKGSCMWKPLTAGVLLLALLADCGNSPVSPESSASSSSASTSSAVSQPKAEGLSRMDKITIAMAAHPNVENYDTNYFTQKIMKDNDVQLEFVLLPADRNDAKTKFSLMVSSNSQLPDVLNLNIGDMTAFDYASKGVFTALNDYYADPDLAPNIQNIAEADRDFIYKCLTLPDGNVYSLFNYGPSDWNAARYRVWINQTWLDKVGMSAPKTTEEYYQTLKAFLEKDANGNGKQDEIGIVGSKDGWGQQPFAFLMNPFIYTDPTKSYINVDENGQLYAAYTRPEWREGLEYIYKLCQEGLLSPLSFTQDYTQLSALVNVEGGVAGTIASGSTSVSSPVLTGMLRMLTVVCVFFCGIFVLPVLELEELLLLLLFDGVAVGVGVDVLFVP